MMMHLLTSSTVSKTKGARVKCPSSMNTYISPLTSKVYQIKETKHTRNAWDSDGNLTPYVQSVFEIYHNGQKVQFALAQDRIADSVAHYENPGPDVSSRYD